MTILILGHTGKIGSFVFNRLVQTDNKIISLGRSRNQCDIYYDFDKKEGDLSNLKNLKVDLIINALGILPKQKAKEIEYSNVNTEPLRILKKHINKNAQIIQLSTIAVYGEEIINRAVKEIDKVKPKNNYAKTKIQAEKIIIDGFKKHWIFRIPPVYLDYNDKVLFKRIILNPFFEIIFNGDKHEHSYCSLNRILEVIQFGCIPSTLPYGIYNLADKSPLTIKQIKSHSNIKALLKISFNAEILLKTRNFFRFFRIDTISEKINEIYYKTCISNLYCTKKIEKYI